MREKKVLEIKGLKQPGYQILGIRPYSANPGDEYLSIVLAKSLKVEGEYVTWIYNWSLNEEFSAGHYTKDYAEAFDDFMERASHAHLVDWLAEVTVRLEDGVSAKDAEIDKEDLGTHKFEVKAYCRLDAIERALDEFHDAVCIGVLDDVHIDCKAKRKHQ